MRISSLKDRIGITTNLLWDARLGGILREVGAF